MPGGLRNDRVSVQHSNNTAVIACKGAFQPVVGLLCSLALQHFVAGLGLLHLSNSHRHNKGREEWAVLCLSAQPNLSACNRPVWPM